MRTLLLVATLLAPSIASAHIHLTAPTGRTDSLTGDQKDQHCGVAGQVRNPARVTTYAPGSTLTVNWMETIPHPGWYRIAFQPDGAVFGIPPAGAGPSNVNGVIAASNFPDVNQEGLDAANGSIVLLDRIADGLLTAQVTLPNIECANCTLQFIQVMIDKPPYTIDALSNDIYFNCADITLSNTPAPPDAGPGGIVGDALLGDGGGPGPGGNGNASGGCRAGGGAGLPIVLALFGLVVRFRRRS